MVFTLGPEFKLNFDSWYGAVVERRTLKNYIHTDPGFPGNLINFCSKYFKSSFFSKLMKSFSRGIVYVHY